MLPSLRKVLVALMLCLPGGAAIGAEPLACTVILDAASGDVLVREGTCDQRFAPASTFKVPLAVIGYQVGILADEHTPRWDWHPGIEAVERDHKAVDPTIWVTDSVLWYSREITRQLGAEAFAASVARLNYGNMDVAGAPGRDNGLTRSWLGASLTISPDEQVQFMRQLVLGTLPASEAAQQLTRAILPRFEAGDGWVVTGKTGSGWVSDANGDYFLDRPQGWFVGWAERGEQTVVFARLLINNQRGPGRLGLDVRAGFLDDLAGLMGR